MEHKKKTYSVVSFLLKDNDQIKALKPKRNRQKVTLEHYGLRRRTYAERFIGWMKEGKSKTYLEILE